ncbi:uncharacterized protein B0P05DRAFT_573458 [Gilbertella persicaria]|uniref:Myb-like domain-containing protein n=1 Tax=Rhizopus stolonifer TaxID=4846 RepID=A0A367J1N7_RHIST|nr:uncharacterized protein B0P05DRAFT_573458 [Gilbertella persicaria]KAI8069832.1 hypothetical protein B0P05DRAFT_573458 [Gilbertella persicaria]RCH83854.1 hypothetical protein CU098_007735 [Rhizopus stolonifer]
MNVSDLLNPLPAAGNRPLRSRCISTPVISSNNHQNRYNYYRQRQKELEIDQLSNEDEDEEEEMMHPNMIGKPRSRFSEYEDNVIRQGVAQRLTWGQISDLLPHRKRATCFNRYRTLQGIRKSRKSSNTQQQTQQQQQQSELETVTSLSPPFDYTQQPYFHANSNLSSSSSSTTSSSDENEDYQLSHHDLPVKRTHKISLPALPFEQQPYYQSQSFCPF